MSQSRVFKCVPDKLFGINGLPARLVGKYTSECPRSVVMDGGRGLELSPVLA